MNVIPFWNIYNLLENGLHPINLRRIIYSSAWTVRGGGYRRPWFSMGLLATDCFSCGWTGPCRTISPGSRLFIHCCSIDGNVVRIESSSCHKESSISILDSGGPVPGHCPSAWGWHFAAILNILCIGPGQISVSARHLSEWTGDLVCAAHKSKGFLLFYHPQVTSTCLGCNKMFQLKSSPSAVNIPSPPPTPEQSPFSPNHPNIPPIRTPFPTNIPVPSPAPVPHHSNIHVFPGQITVGGPELVQNTIHDITITFNIDMTALGIVRNPIDVHYLPANIVTHAAGRIGLGGLRMTKPPDSHSPNGLLPAVTPETPTIHGRQSKYRRRHAGEHRWTVLNGGPQGVKLGGTNAGGVQMNTLELRRSPQHSISAQLSAFTHDLHFHFRPIQPYIKYIFLVL